VRDIYNFKNNCGIKVLISFKNLEKCKRWGWCFGYETKKLDWNRIIIRKIGKNEGWRKSWSLDKIIIRAVKHEINDVKST